MKQINPSCERIYKTKAYDKLEAYCDDDQGGCCENSIIADIFDRQAVVKMKANNGTGNIKERDEWETPQWLFDLLHKQYNFTYDCCSNGKNNKCSSWSSNFKMYAEGFKHIYWMNPPFSKAREMFEHFFKVAQLGVAIYRCDNMETKVWQEVILPNATWIFIPNKRIAYEGMGGTESRFPSALIGFNVPVPKIELGGVTLTPLIN